MCFTRTTDRSGMNTRNLGCLCPGLIFNLGFNASHRIFDSCRTYFCAGFISMFFAIKRITFARKSL